MARTDHYGLAISTTSDEAAAQYTLGVDLMLAAWPGAAAAFDRAIAADPDFALARAARARAHLIWAQSAEARENIAAAERLIQTSGTARERSHVAALALAIRGEAPSALKHVLAHLAEWPRDAFILAMPLGAFGMFNFSGMADHGQANVDLCEQMAPHYGEDWWFLTSLGWAHTEHHNLAHGRAVTERGFALRPQNAHGMHALVHALFEDGSGAEADALITDWLPTYDHAGLLYGHISWHQALVALEAGDVARALQIYEGRVRPSVSAAVPINVVTDCAAFLWRMDAYAHRAPRELWDELSPYAAKAFPRAGLPFVDVHMAMVAAVNGDRLALNDRLDKVASRIADGTLAAGPVVPAICRALYAFAQGDDRACIETLEPLAHEVVRIGGSHAQREVIEDTLIQALLRSGEVAKAKVLLEARLHRRPSVRDQGWLP